MNYQKALWFGGTEESQKNGLKVHVFGEYKKNGEVFLTVCKDNQTAINSQIRFGISKKDILWIDGDNKVIQKILREGEY